MSYHLVNATSSTIDGHGPAIVSSAGNYYWAGPDNGGTYSVFKVVAGVRTTLATGTAAPAAGDVLRLTLTGGTLALDVNGAAEIAPFADATFASGTGGFRMAATNFYTLGNNLLVETDTPTPPPPSGACPEHVNHQCQVSPC